MPAATVSFDLVPPLENNTFGTLDHYQEFPPRAQQTEGCTMDPAKYREYAEDCRKLAKTGSPEHRQKLLEIAAAWEKCANAIEPLAAQESPRSDGKLSK